MLENIIHDFFLLTGEIWARAVTSLALELWHKETPSTCCLFTALLYQQLRCLIFNSYLKTFLFWLGQSLFKKVVTERNRTSRLSIKVSLYDMKKP